MKKLLTIFVCILLVLSFSGCGKKTPTPSPSPTPAPEPTVEKLVSALGTDATVDQALADFNSSHTDWNAFKLYYDDVLHTVEYGVYDTIDIYEKNYEKYAREGVMPTLYFMIKYQDGAETGNITLLQALLPYQNINDKTATQAEGIVSFQKLLLHAVFPQLDDSQLNKLIDRLSLSDEETIELYGKGQIDPSEFSKTTAEVFPSKDSDIPYTLVAEYDKDHNTIMLTFELPKE